MTIYGNTVAAWRREALFYLYFNMRSSAALYINSIVDERRPCTP